MKEVDARGLLCPYPVVELGRAARDAPPESMLVLLSDDPVALTDVPAWCRITGARLAAVEDMQGHWRFTVVT